MTMKHIALIALAAAIAAAAGVLIVDLAGGEGTAAVGGAVGGAVGATVGASVSARRKG